jgi:hypothetical protein
MLASTANAVPVGITGIAPGQSSYFLLAETDAIDFTQNAMFDLTNVGESRILYTGLQVSPVSR